MKIKKTERLAVALSEQEYNFLIDLTHSKKITISEFVVMQVSYAIFNTNFNLDTEKVSGKRKVITVRVSEGFLELVSESAKKYNCSRNALLIKAIKLGLNNAKKRVTSYEKYI